MSFRVFRQADVQDVIELCASAERLTVIAGAGVSKESRLPTWEDLVRRLLRRIAAAELPSRQRAMHDAWIDETITRDGLLGAAAEVAAMTGGADLRAWVREELYGAGHGPADYAPGPIADQLAVLVRDFDGDVRLVTQNYDDLLEQAMAATTPGAGVVAWGDSAPPPDPRRAVAHLHGYEGDAAFAAPGVAAQPLVLSEEQYVEMQLPGAPVWQHVLMRELLEETTCLFVGTSLTDSNLIRYLYDQDPAPAPRHAAVFVRQNVPSHLTPAARTLRERAVAARLRRCNALAGFVDHYSDVAQLLYEVLRRNRGEGGYVRAHKRAAHWLRARERGLLGIGSDAEFRASQDALSEILRDKLDDAIGVAAAAGADFVDETVAVGLWLADPRGTHLVNWVTSDRAYRLRAAITPVRIGDERTWVSVNTYRDGLVTEQTVDEAVSRWRFVRGLPLVLHDPARGRLPVGCLTVASTKPAGATALTTMPQAVARNLHAVLAEEATDLLGG